ncbi:hypothetical protein DEO23_12275 [Brachybacterium endophyticum]|uniref:Tyr recombinase domain-containing protein n=1 Tax=Brachybacterium endophyticum TaxID=2182385 RepID=A0A2U2RHL6_9MICO|nr:tyrosine-type recombinase/integrase [Brachybacterium endophyticum]PWH05362.1 hypothetical protein DEO23_12275 [Brachybacterium endophyticum]
MTKRRALAARTRLSEGEHSIDRAQVTDLRDEAGKVISRRLAWSILLPGDAKPTRRFTQGPPRSTDTAIRNKARATAVDMLEEHTRGGASDWTRRSSLSEFCEAVVRPDIINAPNLSEMTRKAYAASLDLLLGKCDGQSHEAVQHDKALGPKTIQAATKMLAIEACLKEISELHGKETSRRARSVLTGWVFRNLRRHELLETNPIKGERIDLTSMARQREGVSSGPAVALTRDEYNRVVDYLVAMDPSQGIAAPRRGRWGLEHRVTMRRNMISLTLIQAGTGLRISEARQAWRGLVRDDVEHVSIDVHQSIAKGGIPRLAHVLDQRTTWRIRELLLAHPEDPEDTLIVGQAGDRTKVWELAKVRAEARALYDQLAYALDIAKLSMPGHLTHIWRTTMNMQLMAAGVPPAARAQQLGHTEQVALDYYTSAMPIEMAAEASAAIFAG